MPQGELRASGWAPARRRQLPHIIQKQLAQSPVQKIVGGVDAAIRAPTQKEEIIRRIRDAMKRLGPLCEVLHEAIQTSPRVASSGIVPKP